MPSYNYEIGTADDNLVNVEALLTTFPGMPAPKSSYSEFSEKLELGDGSVKGVGWSEAEWRWGFLTQAQRDILRPYCTVASSTVYIRTRRNDNSDEYVYKTGVVIWPEGEEDKDAGRRLDFVLRFRKLTTFTPP